MSRRLPRSQSGKTQQPRAPIGIVVFKSLPPPADRDGKPTARADDNAVGTLRAYPPIVAPPSERKTMAMAMITKNLRENSRSFEGTRVEEFGGEKTYVMSRFGNQALNYASNTSGAFTSTSLQFQLYDLANYGEFTALFDCYQIREIEMMAVANQNVNSYGSSTSILPTLMTVLDFDDTTSLASLNAIVQYQSLQITPWNRDSNRKFRPRVPAAVLNTSATIVASENTGPIWIDSSNPNIQHLGMKLAVTGSSYATTSSWSLWWKYTVAFKVVY